MVAVHYTMNAQIQSVHHIQACSDPYISYWLYHDNHTENEGQEIPGMSIYLCTISTCMNLLVCTSIEDIQAATHNGTHLQEIMTYIIQGWLYRKEEEHSIGQYWPIRNELAMNGGTAMKSKRILPFQLQKHILQQLLSNHMGIEKIRLLVCEQVYWVNMNVDIENIKKQCATGLDYWQRQPDEKTVLHKLPCILLEMVGYYLQIII